jgi:magnesium-transporting ATPase (P-type)
VLAPLTCAALTRLGSTVRFVAAVEEGRSIFSNIRKFLRYLLSSNIGEVMTMFFGVVFSRAIGLEPQGGAVVLPLLATQLLWINLITDGPPALALGLDLPNPMVMQSRPRPASERVITGRMWAGIFFVGAIMAVGTLYVLDASLPGGLVEGTGTLRSAQTKAFTTLRSTFTEKASTSSRWCAAGDGEQRVDAGDLRPIPRGRLTVKPSTLSSRLRLPASR